MWHSSDRLFPFGLARLGPFPMTSVAVVAAAFGFATYDIGGRLAAAPQTDDADAAPATQSIHGAAPNASEFAHELAGMANQFAAQEGDDARLARVDCVQASRGHYMCSFAVHRPSRPMECHVIQAVWTPNAVDSFRVTLSGLAARCRSLRDALRSLQ
jgi:hypothetical protein